MAGQRNTDTRPTILMLIGQLGVGGAERQFVNLALSADPGRYRVVVGVLSQNLDLAGELQQREIPVQSLHTSLDYTPKHLPGLVTRIWRYARSENARLVHTFLPPANIIGSLAGQLLRIPVVISERSVLLTIPQAHKIAYRIITPGCSAIVVNSHANKQSLIRQLAIPKAKIHVHPNGVDFARLAQSELPVLHLRERYRIGLDAPVIGMVNRITPQKDISLFLRAAALVRTICSDARFMIVGNSDHEDLHDYYAEMLCLRNKLGLDDHVILTGAQKNVGDYLRMFDVFVLTSLYEGTPNAMLEAMAMGLPVVATDAGDTAPILQASGGGFVAQRDPEQLAAHILELLGEAELRRRLGNAGRAYVRSTYGLPQLARNAETLWLSLLGSSSR